MRSIVLLPVPPLLVVFTTLGLMALLPQDRARGGESTNRRGEERPGFLSQQ
jgi:hypothetical protein